MYSGCSVGVVVPAYNEERQIGTVLETMPEFVDHIIVVDDRSADATLARCREWQDRLGRRLTVLEQPQRLAEDQLLVVVEMDIAEHDDPAPLENGADLAGELSAQPP